ncbi:MAG: RuBisCO large subunit C-terminal-like domain-containing protein [Actinobacteria bacterium]|jgi:ribulose-bisphosphate carboxylase large chain|nr:RuBisCO large subunit C-terminal-like domain-containing protein [Actinomycetota bacterium]
MTDRLVITYQYFGTDPKAIADVIRVEQSIEFPNELAPAWIQDEVVGKVEEILSVSPNEHKIQISYNPENTGGELPQFLNVLWGNASLFPGVRVIDVEIPDSITKNFKGPRFGISGLRSIFNAPTRPLLTTALKPMGTDSRGLAEMAKTLALAGFDLIKDDHSLANQPWSKWRERVEIVSAAVAQANSVTGKNCAYAPSLNLPFDQVHEAAHTAKKLGAGALLILPGITGFDSMRTLSQDDSIALPIQAHPALLGSFVSSPTNGIAHGIIFGTIARLAGADITIFPNSGGRFSFTPEQCQEIKSKAVTSLGKLKPIWIAPAGGMSIERIPEMLDSYGNDIALLIGGALSRGDLSANAKAMVSAVSGR